MISVQLTDTKSGESKQIGNFNGKANPFVEYNDIGYAEKYYINLSGDSEALFMELDKEGLQTLKRVLSLIENADSWKEVKRMKAIVLGSEEINLLEKTAERYSQLMYDISQPWDFDDGFDSHEEAMKASRDYVRDLVVSGDVAELQEELDMYFEGDLPEDSSDRAIQEYGEYIAVKNMLNELAKTYV